MVSREGGTALGALRHRDFGLFWTAALFSNSAVQMQVIAVPIVMYELTRSTAWVGLAAFCSLIPSFVLTPISGALSDRIPRRLILLVTQSVGAVNAAAYALLWYLDALRPGVILLLQFVGGLTAGFQVSAWQSFVPTLVPRERLLDAVRLNSIQFTTSRALGPAAAGLVLSIWGMGFAFAANAVTYAPVIAALVVVRPFTAEVRRAATTRLRADIAEGARYVRARRALVVAVVTGFMIAFLGQSLTQFAAPIAEELYGKAGDAAKSNLVMAYGIGSVLSSIVVVWAGDTIRRSRLAVSGLLVYGCGVVTIGLAEVYVAGLVGFLLAGTAHVCIAVATNTSIQIQVDDAFRGRVLSIYLMGILGGLPAGALLFGLLGEVADLHLVVAAAGLGLLGFLVVALLRFEGFRLLDDAVLERSPDAPDVRTAGG
jgi:MFS family permease